MAPTEFAAVACGFAYILLAIRQLRACWIAGLASSALYAIVFRDSGLPMHAMLQLVYVALSFYGWFTWRRDSRTRTGPRRLPARIHLYALGGVLVATAASAPLVASYGLAAAPVADSLGTWASLFATWLLARRYADNWIWWIVIDTGLAALFLWQGLAMTAALYLAYAVLAWAGWRSWRLSAGVAA